MMRAMSRRGRSGRRSHLVRPLLSLGLLGAGLLLAGAFVGIAVQGNEIAREAETLRREIAAEQQRMAASEAEISRRRGDEYVVEKAGELGYVRPGEGLIAVERDKKAAPAAASATAAVADRLARWLALFFGPR